MGRIWPQLVMAPVKNGVAVGVWVGTAVAVAVAVGVLVLMRVGVAGTVGDGVLVGVGGDGRSHPVIPNRINKKAVMRTTMFIKWKGNYPQISQITQIKNEKSAKSV
jgi:hypothetical protein